VVVACASDDSSESSPASSTEAVATEPQGTEPPPTDPPRTEPAATEPPTTEATTATAAPEPTGTPAVAAANPHATDAAMAVLEVGGAAVDAAAAIQTVVGLVEPQSPGIGGGAFMLHYDGDTGTITSYDGREEAPSGADPAMFLDVSGAPIGFIDATGSGRAVGTPGAVAMLAAAHDREGALPWADLFSPAIDLASAGFTVSARMAGSLGSAEAFGESDDFLALYASPAGGLLTEGETFTNPAYADTLVPVTDDGAPVANAVAPGKRPRSSMAPMLVLDEDGEVRLAVGGPGGSNIIAYVAKTIVRISDWRLRGADAIGLPNIVGRSAPSVSRGLARSRSWSRGSPHSATRSM
jgi:gamma-glutamyltranspeptidase